eukprot:GHRR01011582.1.p1 GENE.GHRR01011582.1~~GHRR01011582.1.p1  ORF type:complete len:182 (+),score=58.81 GHRR01011582.1:179-724(+)
MIREAKSVLVEMQPTLGTDTFRGAGTNSGLRSAFFGKTLGEAELQLDLLTVQSPVSGSSLTAARTSQHTSIKDPISGTMLQLAHNHAEVVTPVMRQSQVHARNFHLRNDVDIQVAQLRQTNKVNRYTNEKVGTAGRPTGLDPTLLSGSKLRCSGGKQQQLQEQQHQHRPEAAQQQQQSGED